jgi:hypothetical protein
VLTADWRHVGRGAVLFKLVEANLSMVFLVSAAFFVVCAVYTIIFVQEPVPPAAGSFSAVSAKEDVTET